MAHQPTIVIAAYNRPEALNGLLQSLLSADYSGQPVRLVVSIDHTEDNAVRNTAKAFDWPYGEKRIIAHEQRLGLMKHIVACGALTHEYGNIILLEDDLEVASGFYRFALDALAKYADEPEIAGTSLYGYQVAESDFQPFSPDTQSLDAYLMQFPSSWGQVLTKEQWNGFQQYLLNASPQALPPFIQKWGRNSWKKHFAEYLLKEDKYFVYPRVSFSTNKGYAGTHFALRLTLFDVPLHEGPALTLPTVPQMVRYNINFSQEGKSNNRQISKIDVAEAEYNHRVGKGAIEPSAINRLLFIGRYNFHNYWNALKAKILGR